MKVQNCPCGRDKKYEDCCGRVHQNRVNAITAEDLMRSRYVAFTMANGSYLMESHHTETRQDIDEDELVKYAKSMKWTELEILNTEAGGANDQVGTVEFKAYFTNAGKKIVQQEKSIFSRESGLWVYEGIADK